MALRLGESECRGFGSRSRVLKEGGREMFSDGPVSGRVFFKGSGVCKVDLFGGCLGSRSPIGFDLIVRGRQEQVGKVGGGEGIGPLPFVLEGVIVPEGDDP